jgi:hypothetical protein
MSAAGVRGVLAGTWTNLVGYQIVWFIAVAGAGRGQAWPAVAAMAVFATWQLAVSQRRRLELRLAAVACGIGAVLDGGLAASGALHYAAAAPALPAGGAPAWILALWIAFALTVTRSLAWLQGRPLLGALLGAAGAPMAYLGAASGWNAVVFEQPAWPALLGLSAGWAVAIPSLSGLAGRWADDGAARSAWRECAR